MSISHTGLPSDFSDIFVTIAIPTFNRASWLKDCINSALSQTYHHLEVLVLDNNSTDHTSEVLSEFRDPRLRVVRHNKNIGLLPNWNACLDEARGNYIVFLPDDDRIPPWMLERFIALAKSEPQISMVMGLSQLYIAAEAKTWCPPTNPELSTGVYEGIDILTEFFRDRMVTTMCSIMIRTEALRARGGFPIDVPYAADMVAFSLVLLTGRAGFVNECCGTFCVHGEGVTANKTIDESVIDEHRFVKRVSIVADVLVENKERCRQIKSEARRCFARRAVRAFHAYRSGGCGLTKVLFLIWHYRRDLSYIDLGDVIRLARSIVIVLLPKPIADWIRQLKRIRRGQLNWTIN